MGDDIWGDSDGEDFDGSEFDFEPIIPSQDSNESESQPQDVKSEPVQPIKSEKLDKVAGKVKMGYKGVGVIMFLVFLVLGIVLLALYRHTDTPETASTVLTTPATNTQKPAVVDQTPTQPVVTQEEPASVTEVPEGDSLLKIPNTVALDYSGAILEADSMVTSKEALLNVSTHQVVYKVVLTISVGSTSQDIVYYCGSKVYATLAEGDLVNVNYQQVAEGYISIVNLTK